VKSAEEIMEILEAYDLTGSFRDAGELAGCSHHTVAAYVARRDAGGCSGEAVSRPKLIDDFLPQVEGWMQASQGKIRADVAHKRLLALGFTGSQRTTRRAVARVRAAYRLGRVRVHRPWITEPGLWLQYDFGDGPVVDGVKTVLFCAWLAWCRFRVVLALRDKTLPSVFAALDVTFRRIGGVPTYLLTDNEKTVTVEHVAGIAVRNRQMLEFAGCYAVTVKTCVPADPASKGGAENTVKLAKADLVPTDTNLLAEYPSFAALEAACASFCDEVNSRVHRVTRRAPVDMLAEEVHHLHRLPRVGFTAGYGLTRKVPVNTPMVTFESGQYSVPHQLLGATVWVRVYGAGDGEQIVITHVGQAGPVEVARHPRATPGSPQICDEHFPPQPEGALDRTPRARNAAEMAFLAIGPGAGLWLTEAAEAGTARIRVKMAQAVELAGLLGAAEVDAALGHAGVHGRFAETDLASILDHRATRPGAGTRQAGEDASLTQGTTGWAALGTTSQQQQEGQS
jgi:hypothetical protein